MNVRNDTPKRCPPETLRSASSGSSCEPDEARARSRPQRTCWYVRIGFERERSMAKQIDPLPAPGLHSDSAGLTEWTLVGRPRGRRDGAECHLRDREVGGATAPVD